MPWLERTIASARDAVVVVVTARDEAERIAATFDALRAAFPQATVLLADDGSRDATAAIAAARKVETVASGRRRGKGQAASLACGRALELGGYRSTYVLCDADLGASAAFLGPIRDVVAAGDADLAIAAFERRHGGGFGMALAFARWAVRRTTGVALVAPISGQRALTGEALAAALPFAGGFGLELAMTIDALRRNARVVELLLPLEHRGTRRNLAGFSHRARQLGAFLVVYRQRRSLSRGMGRQRRRMPS
jgi:glycosyltransferase involved in cell wall biosynthesis